MSWFDVVPSGRILNRCTKDQSDIDSELPNNMNWTLSAVFEIIVLFSVSSSIIPLFFIIFIFFIPILILQGKKYIIPARDT